MTLIAVLLLFILFLAFFIYFNSLNLEVITVVFSAGESFETSLAILVVGAVLAGFILGLVLHLYSVATGRFQNMRRNRQDKKQREDAALYREGVGRFLSGDLKRAGVLLQKVLEHEPERIECYIALAGVREQEGQPLESIKMLTKARSLAPKNLEVLFKLASIYDGMAQQDEYRKVLEEILTIDRDNSKALCGLRDLDIQSKLWSEALDIQRRLLKTLKAGAQLEEEKQSLIYLRYEVAVLALEKEDFKQAESEFRDIVGKAPEFVPARVSLGDLYRRKGDIDGAARIWQEGYGRLKKAIFLARLEEACLAAEDPTRLLNYYRTTLLENDGDLMLRLFFGKLCLRLEIVDEALEQLYAVESSGADFPSLHLLLAEAHRRRNRIDDAVKAYKKALGAESQLSLGFLCEQCGAEQPNWLSRCDSCGTWGQFGMPGRKSLQSARLLELKAIPHGGVAP